ncbi:unnamed protein product [Menidia menidia]|uniref:(Atlantic silverside) hypothetical protein n=1 Tax=Menidia menidia TaxID=238744 RepID=A0A8S4BSR6_9TELE|nr:unnamed protein product [Menidia menidia]
MVGEASLCSGFPRLKHEGVWKLAMIQNYEWSLKASDFVCRLLGCGSSGSAIVSQHRVRAPAWWISSACFHNKPAFRDCVTHMDALSASTVKIRCSDSVRLVNGADRCSGRLEVRSEQSWSSVCAKDFDQRDAEVVCREVGCAPPLALEGAPYGEVGAPMGATESHCEGQESGLRDCRRSALERSICPAGEAAALTCSDGLRLGGGTSRCQGVLEMENRGQWRPVADLDFVWDQSWTATVCGRLGCGVAVVTVVTDDADVRPVWWVKGGCVRPDAGLRECLTPFFPLSAADLLTPPTITLLDGVSGASEQGPPGAQVLLGSAFSIRCSAPPQYPGGLFLLSREGVQGYSRLAENHSAIFPFPPADRSHQGSYTCILHLHLSEHNFSATSKPLSVSVGGEPVLDEL